MTVSVGLYSIKYKYLKLTYFPFKRRCIILSSQSTQVCTRTLVEVCVLYASVPRHSGSSHQQLQAIINIFFFLKYILFVKGPCYSSALLWHSSSVLDNMDWVHAEQKFKRLVRKAWHPQHLTCLHLWPMSALTVDQIGSGLHEKSTFPTPSPGTA